MVSFRLAAITVLRQAHEPFHYEKITKRALEQGLIETSGSTPEATMNSLIAVDIKNKKRKSAFLRVKPAVFSFNPDYSEEERREEKMRKKRERRSNK